MYTYMHTNIHVYTCSASCPCCGRGPDEVPSKSGS